jgi:hypothetical protein
MSERIEAALPQAMTGPAGAPNTEAASQSQFEALMQAGLPSTLGGLFTSAGPCDSSTDPFGDDDDDADEGHGA